MIARLSHSFVAALAALLIVQPFVVAQAPPAAKGPEGPGPFEFDTATGQRITVSLEINDDVVRGLVTGAEGEAVVETPHTRRAVPISDGWFTATEVPPGLVRIRVTASDGTTVVTQWVRA